MNRTRTLVVVLVTTLIAVVSAGQAVATITWNPTVANRTNDNPRTWDNFGNPAAEQHSGSTFPENNITAISNNGAGVNFIHAVATTDGTAGANDWVNTPNGYMLVPYGGNNAPGFNGKVFPYWDGDCGQLRPHFTTDNAAMGAYPGAFVPETLPGTTTAVITGTNTLTLTFASAATLAHFGFIAIGDRIQTSGFVPAQFNRFVAPATGGAAPGTTPYWTVTGRNAGGTTLILAPSTGSVANASATTIGQMFRGSDCSRAIYTRTTDGGTTWSGAQATGTSGSPASTAFDVAGGSTGGGLKPVLSQTHTEGAGIATYQNFVYVIFYATNGYIAQQCPNDDRPLYIRVNNNYGAWDAWGAPVLIGSVSGQTYYPDIAVDQFNGNVYVVRTDSIGNSTYGNVFVDKSTTNGATWTTANAGQTQNHVYNEVLAPPNSSPATTACSNALRSPQDDFGYNSAASIAAYHDNVAVMWLNSTWPSDKLVAKVSPDAGVSWGRGNFAGSPAGTCGASSNCTQHLAAGGAGGLCPGFSCPVGGPTTCASPYTTCTDGTIGAAFDVVAGPGATAANTRIDFAWPNDSGKGMCLPKPCVANNIPMGLYFQEWNSTAGWQPQRLVSCMRGAPTAPSGSNPCTGKTATLAYGDFATPRLAQWGTTGVGVAFTGCVYDTTNQPVTPCDDEQGAMVAAALHDPGAELLWKESGNSGATWGADASIAGASYTKIAGNGATAAPNQSQDNQFADVVLDKPADSVNGCTQQVNGSPQVGCVRYVFFGGRNQGYLAYKIYLVTGTQS